MTTSVNSDSPASLESEMMYQDCAATEPTIGVKFQTTGKVDDEELDHDGDRSSVTSTMSSKARINKMKKTLGKHFFGDRLRGR